MEILNELSAIPVCFGQII